MLKVNQPVDGCFFTGLWYTIFSKGLARWFCPLPTERLKALPVVFMYDIGNDSGFFETNWNKKMIQNVI
jgi:hypothetical protein